MRKIVLLYSFLTFLVISSFAQGKKAPDFTVTDIYGKRYSLYKDYLDKDKAVLLKLFFVDCPPCNAQAPTVQSYYANDWQSGDGKVEFIELSVKAWDNDDDVKGYVMKHGITFVSVSSQGNSLVAASPYTRGDYGRFLGTPTYVIIGPKGDVHFRIPLNQINDTLKAVLKTPPPPDNSCPSAFNVHLTPYGKAFYGLSQEDFDVRLMSDDETAKRYELPFKDSLYAYECDFDLPVDTVSYSLNASIHADAYAGVNTKDLLFVLWHLIGKRPFKDQILLYASDVNENGLINIQDILFIRQIILQKRKAFPKDSAVRVWDATHEIELDTLTDTLPITRNTIPLYDLLGNKDIKLKAVKLGDITGTEEGLLGNRVNATRTNATTTLLIRDRHLKKGHSYQIPVRIRETTSLYTFQAGMKLYPDAGTLSSIMFPKDVAGTFTTSSPLNPEENHFMLVSPKDAYHYNENAIIFTLQIKMNRDALLSEVLSVSKDMEAMLTDVELREHDINLKFLPPSSSLEVSGANISYLPLLHRLKVSASNNPIKELHIFNMSGNSVLRHNYQNAESVYIQVPESAGDIFIVEVIHKDLSRTIRRFVY